MTALVVFGATGDLTGRLLLPAVAALHASGALGHNFRFVGVGNQDWSAGQFADHVRAGLSAHAPGHSPADVDRLLEAITYQAADIRDPAKVAAVLDRVHDEIGTGPMAVYLALPTQLMLNAVQAIAAHGLASGNRLAVEKPLGYDDVSAAELNDVLAGIGRMAGELAIYRVDHALAMTGVQRLPQARHPETGRRIEWDSRRIEQVDVLFEETLALEGRAAFYDRAGALRDVMQNHQLVMLSTLAQPPVPPASSASPADRRAAVLRAVPALSTSDIASRTRRARYSAGRLASGGTADGRAVPDYWAEGGVDPSRDTETFAEVILEIATAQWTGTRFVLRAGKALRARRRGILVHFRPDSSTGVADDPAWLDIDEPDDSAGAGAEPAAYQRIVADLLSGGSAYAVGAAETELAWQIMMPVLRGWQAGLVPMRTYPAGSDGPA